MRKNGLEELILIESVDRMRSRGKTGREMPYQPKQMGDRTAPKKRERKKRKENKSVKKCKRQKYVEIHDCPWP